MNKLQRWFTIKRLAKLAYRYDSGWQDMGCGRHMAETIRPRLYTIRMEIEAILKRLRKDDEAKT